MLIRHGEFYPHGAAIDAAGKLAVYGAMDESNRPKSAGLILLLEGAFRARAAAGEIRACGICFDVKVATPGKGLGRSDAIQCRLEHLNGESVNVFKPWKRGLLGRIRYGQVFATEGTRQIFPSV